MSEATSYKPWGVLRWLRWELRFRSGHSFLYGLGFVLAVFCPPAAMWNYVIVISFALCPLQSAFLRVSERRVRYAVPSEIRIQQFACQIAALHIPAALILGGRFIAGMMTLWGEYSFTDYLINGAVLASVFIVFTGFYPLFIGAQSRHTFIKLAGILIYLFFLYAAPGVLAFAHSGWIDIIFVALAAAMLLLLPLLTRQSRNFLTSLYIAQQKQAVPGTSKFTKTSNYLLHIFAWSLAASGGLILLFTFLARVFAVFIPDEGHSFLLAGIFGQTLGLIFAHVAVTLWRDWRPVFGILPLTKRGIRRQRIKQLLSISCGILLPCAFVSTYQPGIGLTCAFAYIFICGLALAVDWFRGINRPCQYHG